MDKKIRCWDCKFLGTCQKASGKIEECENFLYYKDNYRFLTRKQISKFLELDERTIYRYLEKIKYILENLEKITNKQWYFKKSNYDGKYYIMEVEKDE